MKRVLLIADSNMSLSGVPVVFMSIVKNLSKEYLFDIIVLKDNDMYFENEFLSYGGKVYRFNCPKPDGFFKKFIWLSTKYYKAVRNFLSNLNLKEYDAIHSFHEGFSYPFLKEAKIAGIKRRILHICSARSAYKQKTTLSQILFNWYQRKAIRNTTNVAFVSKQSLDLNHCKSKGVVLYNTYDEEKFGEIIECSHNNLVLTQIATFSFRKNQLFSLEVIKRIKEKIPNVTLNIVGYEIQDGYLEKMNNFIKNNKLEENVKYLGNKANRVELNKITSFILYPSTMESFGLVLIESQACGIHCFANKDIPNDADMGNTDFLELNADLWASRIIDYFDKNKNNRTKPINKDKFSKHQFAQTLKYLYTK